MCYKVAYKVEARASGTLAAVSPHNIQCIHSSTYSIWQTMKMGFAVVAGVAYEHQVQVTKPSPQKSNANRAPPKPAHQPSRISQTPAAEKHGQRKSLIPQDDPPLLKKMGVVADGL